MTNDPIYVDHNATTPLQPEVVDAMLPYLREHFGNPSTSRDGVAVRMARGARAQRHPAQLARAAGALIHTDAAQSLG